MPSPLKKHRHTQVSATRQSSGVPSRWMGAARAAGCAWGAALTLWASTGCGGSGMVSLDGGGGAGGGSGGGGGGPAGWVDPIADAGPLQPWPGTFADIAGLRWLPSANVLLVSDRSANRVFRSTPDGGFESWVTRNAPRGIDQNAQGEIILCEGPRVTRTGPDGGVSLVAVTFDGGTFNSPRDVAARGDGNLYFTDPVETVAGSLDLRGVFRVSAGGAVTLLHSGRAPFGVALSRSQTQLFFTEQSLGTVQVVGLAADGAALGQGQFVGTVGGGLVGATCLAVDAQDNLYVGARRGVKVYLPDGGFHGALALPVDEDVWTCTFGEPDLRALFVGTRNRLFRVRLNGAGLP